MITVTLYYRPGCSECDEVEQILHNLQSSVPHQLVKVNVDSDPDLKTVYGEQVPAVQVGPYRLRERITEQDLLVALGAARDRQDFLERSDDDYRKRLDRGHTVSQTDRFSYWLSRRYMVLINLLVFLYVGLPFLAPVLMKANITFPARVIYTVYSPLCHQFAFRSWFLFGEQAYYPRSLAMIPGATTYEAVVNTSEVDLYEARSFIGDEAVGYKVALCQRDIAMYGGLLLFGLLFVMTGKKIKSIPWYLWLLIGVVPIGWDGASQLPSLMGVSLPGWLPIRESSPMLRSLTGALFGITTAWYIFPLIEDSMRETRAILARKMAVVAQTGPKKQS